MTIERMGFEKDKRIIKKYGNISESCQIGDKVCNFRSQGEKRLAQYLELLKLSGHIRDWAFEQTTFKTSAGEKFWIVDFDVLNNDGTFEYYEFKGMFKQSDATKLQLLYECKPDIQLTYVFENKREAGKLSRRKVSRQLKAIMIQSTSGKGLTEFDGRVPKKRKRR